jgi:putative heme-binding domain-containing protein
MLYKHFTDEIIPALGDLGGGSGTGAMFMDEPTWPQQYNKVPMMADWGRSMLYIHRVSPDGPTFTQSEEEFIKLPQITDLDVDGSGRLYLAAWDGAGYSGSPNKGYVVRAVPKDWTYKVFRNPAKASIRKLTKMLKSPSAVARISASQELLSRKGKKAVNATLAIASDKNLPLAARVAGIYTYAQLAEKSGVINLVKLAKDSEIREFALRALADRKGLSKNVPLEPFLKALNDPSERVRAVAIVGLGRLGQQSAAAALLQIKVPGSFTSPGKDIEGPHAKPNAAIVLPHLAVQSLVSLKAVDASVSAIHSKNPELALWALRYMHDQKAVKGLINAYQTTNDAKLKRQILTTLSRLYKRESAYDASWWWGTRPDTHGPYYRTETWEASPVIERFLKTEWDKTDASGKLFFKDLNARHRMEIAAFGTEENLSGADEPKVDLEKIKNQKGQVGKSSIEDVLLAIAALPGNPAKGKALFARQGCVACHSISQGEKMKGPFMGQIGSIMNREQIAESILKPDASISQGFATVMITAKGDKTYMGFITEETSEKIVMRNIAGEVFTIKAADILTRKEMETSMMPAGLANSLSYEELASLVTFLSQQKK